jgi:hypothetical protein
MKAVSLIASLAAVAFFVGCATQSHVSNLAGRGTQAVYNAPFDSVWRAAIDAAQRDGLEVTSTDRAAGYIAARRNVQVHTFGENVGIWLRRVSPAQTEVEVVSRQAGPPVAWLKNWENEIHRSIAANLTREVPVYGTVPRGTYLETERVPRETLIVPEVQSPTTPIVPRGTLAEREQLRRIDALRSERDERQRELDVETDFARRDALRRQISALESDIQSEEKYLRELRNSP